MLHFNLGKYYNTFINLCGESGYNPDDQHVKTSFHQGLNNLSTRGGLRTQLIDVFGREDLPVAETLFSS
eukprot:1173639-Prorocentrum_minimum.AAC.1